MPKDHIIQLLPLIQRPSRHLGCEVGSVRKDLSTVPLSMALVFPDLYEVGMSHLGLHILYGILNSRHDIAAERVFAPPPDMKLLMEKRGIPLLSLESRRAVREFDIVGITLPSELSYTTVLSLLRLASLPLLSEERRTSFPLVIGGGGCAFNPEPLAPFFDAFFLGEAEEAILEIADAVLEAKKSAMTKEEIMESLGRIGGMYIPSAGTSRRITRRVVPDLDDAPCPQSPIVPFTRLVHDRWNIEIARGCTLGCRFCQAGMIYRPVRERDPAAVFENARAALDSSGWEDITLLSLSAGDYTCIAPLLRRMMDCWSERKIALSLPSLRAGSIRRDFLQEMKRVRKTGFTIAPETGSQRLRSVINKPISDDDIFDTVQAAFQEGWQSIKLYFMMGLPTETDDDVESILTLSSALRKMGRTSRGRPTVTASVGTYVPKPHTPFQWEAMLPLKEAERRLLHLRKESSHMGLELKWHDPRLSYIEAVLARGDRSLVPVLLRAVEQGCYLDTWSENVRHDIWSQVLTVVGDDSRLTPYRQREREEPLPWDHVDAGVTKEFLWKEREKSRRGEMTEDCFRGPCTNCGVCDFVRITPRPAVHGEEGPQTVPSALTSSEKGPGWVTRFRIKYSKIGDLRYLSHLELMSCISRALRRAGIPMRYSRGYHPLPKLSFGPALPVGTESEAEYVDVEIEGTMGSEDLRERMNIQLPQGVRVLDITPVPLSAPSISESIREVQYLVDIGNLDRCAIEASLTSLEGMELLDGSVLRLSLRHGNGHAGRPQDILGTLLHLTEEEKRTLSVRKVSASFGPT